MNDRGTVTGRLAANATAVLAALRAKLVGPTDPTQPQTDRWAELGRQVPDLIAVFEPVLRERDALAGKLEAAMDALRQIGAHQHECERCGVEYVEGFEGTCNEPSPDAVYRHGSSWTSVCGGEVSASGTARRALGNVKLEQLLPDGAPPQLSLNEAARVLEQATFGMSADFVAHARALFAEIEAAAAMPRLQDRGAADDRG